MLYDKNEFRQDDESTELNEHSEFSFLDDESTGRESFFHEDEYNRDAYVGLADRDEFEPGEAEAMDEYRSWAPGRKSILQKAMRVLKVRAITIAAGTVIITSPVAEKTGLTYPGASNLRKPDGTPILPQTHRHVFNGWTEEEKSSCTQPGTEVLICTDCNRTVEVLPVPRSNHPEPVWTLISEGNCSQPEKKQLICPDCGEILETETTPATGHTAGRPVTDTEAGCLTDGVRHTVCEDCGETIETVTIPATGHIAATIAGYAPTCTQAGLTDGQQCADCGILLTASMVIPATGHTEITDRAIAPTCSAAGKTEGSHCDVCGEVIIPQQTVEMLPHTEVIDQAVAATCSTTGLTEGSHCDVCGEVIIPQEATPMLDHTWQADPDNTAQHYCTVCGTTGLHTENLIAERVAATCTTPGSEEHIECSDCQYPISQPIEIPALGHTEIIDQAVAATCTATGLTEGSHCDVCNEVIIPQQTIDALGHTWEPILSADTGEADPDQHQCTVCNEIAQHNMTANANGHACDDCGYAEAHTYTASADGLTHTCEKCSNTGAHTPVVKYDDSGMEDYSVHICSLCNAETPHSWTATSETHGTHQCDCGLVQTLTAASFESDDTAHTCTVCNTATAHTWTVAYMDDGSLDPDNHQCTICQHQAAHIWDPEQVSPNGHVCSCGYTGAHTFSTDTPTDTDTCDICHETWATINNW